MKKFILGSLLFLSFGVFANIGDTSTYDISTEGETGTMSFLVSDINNQSKMFVVDETITDSNGNEQTSSSEVEKVWDHETAAQVILFCAVINGKIDTLEVLGKEMQTCKVEGSGAFFQQMLKQINTTLKVNFTGDATVWFGDVPVTGIAKATLGNGGSMELTGFTWAP